MGLFDKLKSMKNAITGGSAKVRVEVGEATTNGPFTVTVTATVDDAPLKIDAVYVLIRGVEEVKVDGDSVARQLKDRMGETLEAGSFGAVENDEETCDFRVNISGPEELKANETYTWTGEVKLPQGSKPTFVGRMCRHTYYIEAGLDTFGNDPDSDWVQFDVN